METTGITLTTVLAVVCGLLVHILKQLITARRAQASLSLRGYILNHWPESLLSLLCALVLFLAIPELAALFPDFAKPLGLEQRQTIISSFVAGFMGNSIADFIGGRAKAIAGVNPPSP